MNPQILENNYVYIPNFISPERAKLLASNFENFCIENNIAGDDQIEQSHSKYNYIDFLELLCNATPEVGEFLGENVLPTYTYSRVYKRGAELIKHTDRDACEISLTVHLDGDKDWPIYIKNPKGETISLNLKSGDAMMYLGCDAEHWRDVYEGDRYVQVFLHYVRSRGDKGYAYFDKVREKKPKKDESQENIKSFDSTSQSKLLDYIHVFENIIPDELCDLIVREYKNTKDLLYATIGYGIEDREIRNVRGTLLSDTSVIAENQELRKTIDDKIHQCLIVAMQKYNAIHNLVVISRDSGFNFLQYDVGNFYKKHVDSFTAEPRAISCSIALNDDFEGGEFTFFDNEIKYNLKKGSVLMFPSNFMYPHEVLPVTKGTRFSIVTWFI
jgi:Rps23 Pro-64 3,4-dihydroxylase Tpa1-like proline 4-hydroxylase